MKAWRPLHRYLRAEKLTRLNCARCIRGTASAALPNNIAALLRASAQDPSSLSKQITINGFIRSIRKQKRVAFANVDDGSSLEAIQAVLTPGQAVDLSNGAAVTMTGKWQRHPSGKEQAHELHVEHVTQAGPHDALHYPIQKKYHSPDFLRTLPHLRLRIPSNALLLRLRSEAILRLSTFFAANGYVQIHTPTITSSDCEGAGEVFTVATDAGAGPTTPETASTGREHFFRSPKYLTVSSQLHLEAAAQAVGKVWTLSPTFRAEKSDTSRHLSEFYMLEAELTFVNELAGVMDLVENLLRDLAQWLQQSTVGQELLAVQTERSGSGEDRPAVDLMQRWTGLARLQWPRITYAEAIRVLQDSVQSGAVQFEYAPDYDSGLQAEHERYLADHVGHCGPVFVTNYPKAQKPFYMAASQPEGPASTVACFDLLLPEVCEVVGGSLREHELDKLMASMQAAGLAHGKDSSLDWYVDLRRYGSVPHGGFGMGFDRVLGYLSGVSNIRDVVTFPRWHGRCDC